MKPVLAATLLMVSVLGCAGSAHAQGVAIGAKRGAAEGDRVGGPIGAALGRLIGGIVGGSAAALGRDLSPADYRSRLPSRPGYQPVRMSLFHSR